ncbi:MAG TPA: tripartite tricarboxylate transporter TctB family protein [Xanthobacteraceae bacterium]|nr:tripartite tricarboxylate transporter TctB family protein [Xanthobacteraceae bacterium]
MRVAVGRRKDFWTGVIYIVIGLSALVIARNYALGSAARMGPGYFPTAVALLLTAVGVTIVVRSFVREGELVDRFAWKPMLLVLGSIVAFGILINRAGLPLAAVVLVLGCAAASERFRIGWPPMLGMAALVAFCVIVFVIGMGIPMPLIGPWFTGIGE